MAHRPRRWTLLTVGLIGAACAAMMLGTSRDASALDYVGCDISPGNATHTVSSTANYSAWTTGPQPFTAGDIIMVSLSPGDSSTGVAFGTSPVTAVAGVQSVTYIIPSSANYNIYVSILDPNNLTLTVSFSCTHAASNSTNIRSLQTSITTAVATTSGQVITNAIDGGINDAFSDGGTPTNFGPNGGFINFAAPEPKSQTASRADEAFAALGYAGNPTKAPNFNKAPPPLEREWSAWADIRDTGWKVNDTTGNGNDIKGNQINLTAGLGRKLNTDTLVGLVVGYEYFKYDVAALAGSLKGDGETIGGYFARRFGNLRFDAALGWTNLNYSATAGTATGSFIGSRWLASMGLTENYKVNVYVIEPSAKVFMLWESQQAWTDSLGNMQDSRNFSAGRTALGAKVARPFEASNGWTLSPYAGLYGDWRLQTDNALPTGATPVANIGTGWSGRVTAGLMAKAAGGSTVSLDGEYGGLGANYKIWTGNVRVAMPF